MIEKKEFQMGIQDLCLICRHYYTNLRITINEIHTQQMVQ